jgi:hypothetical protein
LKKLFAILLVVALSVALGLVPAATVGATNGTTTTYVDTTWQKTINGQVEATVSQTAYPVSHPSWTWTSTVWDGPGTNVLGGSFSLPGADYWAKFPHNGTDWSNFTHYWFTSKLDVCSPLLAADIKLVDKYDHNILSINDNLYVFVNGTLVASGGTAGVSQLDGFWQTPWSPPSNIPRLTGGFPSSFVPAVYPYSFGVAPGTGWYINGGLTLPKSAFQAGWNTIEILVEEFAGGGGFAHPEFAVTTYNVNMGDVTPTEDFNPVGTEHTVSVDIGNAVAGIEVTFATDAGTLGTALTNASGIASLTYTSYTAGKDVIYAYIDANGNSQWDEGEPKTSANAEKYWLEPFVTGGGNIKTGKTTTWTFGGNVGLLDDTIVPITIVGQFQIVDHTGKQAVAWHCNNAFTSLTFSGVPTSSPPAHWNVATFTGTFTSNKGGSAILTVIITDVGEPGTQDTIVVTGDFGFSGTPISGGNFQVHD